MLKDASPAAICAIRDSCGVGAYAKLAFIMLWARDQESHPSIRVLTADMGVSESTARRALRELSEAGLITQPADGQVRS